MRNYYPLTYRQIEDAKPYTVHVHLIDGTAYSRNFPTYSAAKDYYDTFALGGVNCTPDVSSTSLRPTD